MSLIESITVKNLDHLGIVAGLIDEIGIVELINQKLGVHNREKIATGQVIKALILNGLWMVSRPLYLSSQFFEDKVICLLYTSPSPRDATLSRMPSSA